MISDDSNKPNRIVQMNGLHASYNTIVIEIFDVKIVNAINSRVYTSRRYGILFSDFKSDF